MQPVTDMNEVTMHTLEIIYTHLFNTKGALPGKSAVGGGAAVAQPMNVSSVRTYSIAIRRSFLDIRVRERMTRVLSRG